MSCFVPTKRNLRVVLLFFPIWTHWQLEVFVSCEKPMAIIHHLFQLLYRFRWFNSRVLDLEDMKRPIQSKKFEDKDQKSFLDDDQCQTLTEALKVTQITVSQQLKCMGLFKRQEIECHTNSSQEIFHVWIPALTTKKGTVLTSYRYWQWKIDIYYSNPNQHKITVQSWLNINFNRKPEYP